jgi:CO dehydrogenase nickel-insertion accessory protein CooC1
MLGIIDFQVNNVDDIMFDSDFIIEDSIPRSLMRTIERRLVAKEDDFIIDDIAAGLESFLFGYKTPYTKDDIQIAINNSLQTDSLLNAFDYKILLDETQDKRVHIIIKFTNSFDGAGSFRIIVDIENQKIYRG